MPVEIYVSIIAVLALLTVIFVERDRVEKQYPFSFAFSKIRNVKSPCRGMSGSAGLDFFVPRGFVSTCQVTGNTFRDAGALKSNDALILGERAGVNIPSGIRAEVPRGFVLVAFNKSGVALKAGLQVGACVVDEDYQGEIHLHVTNVGAGAARIVAGQKLVQFLLLPVCSANVFEIPDSKMHQLSTTRGHNGFGSTGTGLTPA